MSNKRVKPRSEDDSRAWDEVGHRDWVVLYQCPQGDGSWLVNIGDNIPVCHKHRVSFERKAGR